MKETEHLWMILNPVLGVQRQVPDPDKLPGYESAKGLPGEGKYFRLSTFIHAFNRSVQSKRRKGIVL